MRLVTVQLITILFIGSLWAQGRPVAQVSFVYDGHGNPDYDGYYTARLDALGYVEVYRGAGTVRSVDPDSILGGIKYSADWLAVYVDLVRELIGARLETENSLDLDNICGEAGPAVPRDLFVFPAELFSEGPRMVLTEHGCWRRLRVQPQDSDLRERAVRFREDILSRVRQLLYEHEAHAPPDPAAF